MADLQFCIQHIRSCLRSPDFGSNCQDAQQLCEELQDGEVLCELLTELSNGDIYSDTTYYSVNSQLLARKNVRLFLKNVRKQFRISDAEIFEIDDLLEAKNPNKVIATLCAVFRSANLSQPQQKLEQLPLVVVEMVEIEQSYFLKLKTLLQIRNQLQGILSDWSEDLLQSVFGVVKELFDVHQRHIEKLTALADKGCETFCREIGSHFSEHLPSFKVYENACADLILTKKQLESEFKENPKLKEQLDKLIVYYYKQPISLHSLYCPIKQLTNYQNLLDRMQKLAEAKMPQENHSIHEALQKVKEFLSDVNEYVRHKERVSATEDLLKQISKLPKGFDDIDNVGLHRIDAMFKVKCEITSKKGKVDFGKCFCLLTDKQLICATHASGEELEYAFTCCISSSMKVQQDGTSLIAILPERTIYLTPMKLTKNKDAWEKQLNELRLLNFPPGWNLGEHRFSLHTFPPHSVCHRCKQLLQGFMYQGYKCSHCSLQVHKQCVAMRRRSSLGITSGRPASDFVHEGVDRQGSKALLCSEEVGTFLIRSKQGNEQQKVLSLKKGDNEFVHIVISQKTTGTNGKVQFSLENANTWHDSLEQLIEFYKFRSMEIHFPELHFKLGDGVPSKTGLRL